jgi:hypothetical protein
VGILLQATDTGKIFDHDNYLNFGGSVGRSWLSYSANATLGVMQPNFVIDNGGIPGGGEIIQDQSLTDHRDSVLLRSVRARYIQHRAWP